MNHYYNWRTIRVVPIVKLYILVYLKLMTNHYFQKTIPSQT